MCIRDRDQVAVAGATMEPQPQPVQVLLRLPGDPIPQWAVPLLSLQAHQVCTQKFLHLSNGQRLPKPSDRAQGLPAFPQKAAVLYCVQTIPCCPTHRPCLGPSRLWRGLWLPLLRPRHTRGPALLHGPTSTASLCSFLNVATSMFMFC